VRTFRPALGALVVLLLLVFCADTEAGRHCRQQRCGNTCCAIPCWVRWIEHCGYATACPDGYNCYCCSGANVISCNAGSLGCDPNTLCCVRQSSNFKPNCGTYGGRGYACQEFTTCCTRLYAMVCDPCCHVLRFALPWEIPDVYGPLHMLGSPCPPDPSKDLGHAGTAAS
jgi:hypothetical protein